MALKALNRKSPITLRHWYVPVILPAPLPFKTGTQKCLHYWRNRYSSSTSLDEFVRNVYYSLLLPYKNLIENYHLLHPCSNNVLRTFLEKTRPPKCYVRNSTIRNYILKSVRASNRKIVLCMLRSTKTSSPKGHFVGWMFTCPWLLFLGTIELCISFWTSGKNSFLNNVQFICSVTMKLQFSGYFTLVYFLIWSKTWL